ncbi:hypothetical protein BKA67DRAFT_664401 [Truncatella angustata]|uniref:Uncharacterized protein n=1 Tax=Truncatella angustata TaxID=152316 RepID=A0A9P8UAY1_9PEZI|nr:uncharacterized protein BKA67DRAFT_664401 [Truncatella angustata]KAH6645302.1 hypothetical protein BKA67DRAFT_664401 [Truncatella angustata]KAH8203324.1 hypothetical protein TruAng_002520 [Truncatella angustata]
MFKRLVVLIFNVIFPPAAVFLLTGFGADFAMNCFLFILAVIPSHIHGMYISFVYFRRKNKVRKGRWPGRRRGLIYSDKVQNGGATRAQLEDIRRNEEERAAGRRDGKKVAREWKRTA